MRKGYIYKITSPTGKIYIGQTVNIKQRFKAYQRIYCTEQPKIYNSLKKYSIEKHSFEVIYEGPEYMLDYVEKVCIIKYNSIEEGLNCREGGQDGKQTKEAIEKSAAKRRGQKRSKEFGIAVSKRMKGVKFSEETKKKQSLCRKGKKKNMTPEGSKKIQEAVKKYRANGTAPFAGKKHSEETKKKLSELRKGRIITDEWREKLSIAQKERYKKIPSHMKGNKESDMTKRKKSEKSIQAHKDGKFDSVKKPIVQLNPDNTMVRVWESKAAIKKELGIYTGTISYACINKNITKGYKWMFKKDYDKTIAKENNQA